MKAFDSFHIKGDSHLVCQDYAFSRVVSNKAGKTVYLGVVSDGCSGAPRSEMGSTLLVTVAVNLLVPMIENAEVLPEIDESFFLLCVQKLREFFPNMEHGLYSHAATLIVYMSRGQRGVVHMMGDGAVFWMNRDGSKHMKSVRFSKERPFYPEYMLSYGQVGMHNSYNQNKILTVVENGVEHREVVMGLEPQLVTLHFANDNLKFIFVTTDGFTSSRKTEFAALEEFSNIEKFSDQFAIQHATRFKNNEHVVLAEGDADPGKNWFDDDIGGVIGIF